MNQLKVEELIARLESGKDVRIVDIREAGEYQEWHIPGSINVPVFEALAQGDLKTASASLADVVSTEAVVTVCRAGQTSQRAVSVLEDRGQAAVSLEGGMLAWSGAWTAVPVNMAQSPNAVLIQIRRNGKGCLSYLLGSAGEAAIIDPAVDAAVYQDVARKYGLTIKYVLETHIHADHVSRAQTLAKETGAALTLPQNDRVKFAFEPVKDGQIIRVGDIDLEVMGTPGHTGESVCYLVAGQNLLSGDTLFVDAIGRPDLEMGDEGARAGAEQLYHSLHGRVLKLPDDIWVYPGHTGSPVPFERSPIGAQLGHIKTEIALLSVPQDSFVDHIVASLPAKPPNFHAIIAVNEGESGLGGKDPLDLEAGPNRCAVN
jgi:glyoxylase-like metal-dependent hydrolase (beta-lactamase superfamily II)